MIQIEDKNQWEEKVNKQDVKVFMKKGGGSFRNKSFPYFKSQALFNSSYSIRKIIDTVTAFSLFVCRYLTLNIDLIGTVYCLSVKMGQESREIRGAAYISKREHCTTVCINPLSEEQRYNDI